MKQTVTRKQVALTLMALSNVFVPKDIPGMALPSARVRYDWLRGSPTTSRSELLHCFLKQ